MDSRKIEINRNIIERFLMWLKDFLKKNKRPVLYSSISIMALLIIVISGAIYFNSREIKELKELETILDAYYSNADQENQGKNFQKTAEDLKKLVNSTMWGYVNRNGYYIIAGLYISVNNYNEGKEYLLKFVDRSPSSFFAPLALHRAGLVSEKLNDINGALQIYERLENNYGGSVISDENYYDIGRIYQVKGNSVKAKEYYNKVISEFPVSIFASKAKERLLLLGYREETANNKKLAM